MEDQATFYTILIGTLTLTTILARIVEKLVDKLINKKKEKELGGEERALTALNPPPKGITTDLALQSSALRELREDVERVFNATSGLVLVNERLGGLADRQKEILGRLESVQRAIDNNTSATKALHNFLAAQNWKQE